MAKKKSGICERMNRKTKECLQEGILYAPLWKGNLCTKVAYILIPFLLIMILGLILFFRDAFRMESGYSFIDDYTDCYVLCCVYFFVYFVHGFFLHYFSRQLKLLSALITSNKKEIYWSHIQLAKIVISVISCVVACFAIWFIYTGYQKGDASWYSKLNRIEQIYYACLIVTAWIMSARLFVTILMYGILTYKLLYLSDIRWDFGNPDCKCGLKGLFNALVASMGFGLYFTIAVGMIIYSDYRAYNLFHIELGTYTYAWLIISIAIILAVIYYSVLIIAHCALNERMREAVIEEYRKGKMQNESNKENLRHILDESVITIDDLMIFFLSVLFPGVAALIQIMQPFV